MGILIGAAIVAAVIAIVIWWLRAQGRGRRYRDGDHRLSNRPQPLLRQLHMLRRPPRRLNEAMSSAPGEPGEPGGGGNGNDYDDYDGWGPGEPGGPGSDYYYGDYDGNGNGDYDGNGNGGTTTSTSSSGMPTWCWQAKHMLARPGRIRVTPMRRLPDWILVSHGPPAGHCQREKSSCCKWTSGPGRTAAR